MSDKNQGEGNREADRRYREGVRKTLDRTTAEERAEKAREISPEEQREAEQAERDGKDHARH